MEDFGSLKVCKSCGFSGNEKYCGQCGQLYYTKRITLSNLLHDAFHFFTHLDKGFGYTLIQLIISPGKMQQAYLAGDRARHQKPFSMFFICATVGGLVRYWIFLVILKYYEVGNTFEAKFFHEYWVLLQISLMPFNILFTYLLFYKSKYNYAEVGVFLLYTVSFFFLLVTVLTLFKFIWPELDTAYIELPLLIIYNGISFLNFFKDQQKWLVVVKSLSLIAFMFFATQLLEDLLIKALY